ALVVGVGLARLIDRFARRAAPKQALKADTKLAEGPNGFRMILSDRYLILIAALVLFLNVVNTSGEYLFGRYVVDAATARFAGNEAAKQQFIGETYSNYFSYINLTGFLLQLFVVSRLFKRLGVARSLFVHPIVALISYVTMLSAPSLEAMRWLKIA